MSLEAKIDELIAALDRNTAAQITTTAPPKKGKAAVVPDSAPQAATPAPAATAPAAQPAQSPAGPTPPLTAVNKATQALAQTSGGGREAAIKILTRFGAVVVKDDGKTIVNTSLLQAEHYQTVLDAMEEQKATFDAAATQVSLV
jgi:hypothetical protein